MIKAIVTSIAVFLGLIAIQQPQGEWRIAAEQRTEFPPRPTYAPTCHVKSDDVEWNEFMDLAFCEYLDEFTALFNAVEFKVAKNGRSMVKSANGGSFKFAKKG